MDPQIIAKIVADASARRELLWLRAKEKEDAETALDLERADPGLVERLRSAGVDLGEQADEGSTARRERFGRLFDDCFDRHARSVVRASRGP